MDSVPASPTAPGAPGAGGAGSGARRSGGATRGRLASARPARNNGRMPDRSLRRSSSGGRDIPMAARQQDLVCCKPMTRFIFITGGVVSSLGKGLSSAALGALLQARGYRVRLRKLDPYLNVDPGTMSPYQHGEVFVTDDGAETDLDLGHYERFTGVDARQSDNITTGRIYSTRDRQGAARRVSRRHGAGDPAHHRRHQGIHRRRYRARGLRAGRDRRHGGRHRRACRSSKPSASSATSSAANARCSCISPCCPGCRRRASSRPSRPSTRSRSF